MCGRYLIEDDSFSKGLDITALSKGIAGATKGEIFPTNIAPIILESGVEAAKWGFPHWKSSSAVINARSETALEKNMFRKPLLERRCAIPSNGFYEWKRVNGQKKKDKFLLRMKDSKKLFMAGMMSIFKDAFGDEYSAFVILTTAAVATAAEIHDRMPVILLPEELDRWVCDTAFMEHALRRPGPDLLVVPA